MTDLFVPGLGDVFQTAFFVGSVSFLGPAFFVAMRLESRFSWSTFRSSLIGSTLGFSVLFFGVSYAPLVMVRTWFILEPYFSVLAGGLLLACAYYAVPTVLPVERELMGKAAGLYEDDVSSFYNSNCGVYDRKLPSFCSEPTLVFWVSCAYTMCNPLLPFWGGDRLFSGISVLGTTGTIGGFVTGLSLSSLVALVFFRSLFTTLNEYAQRSPAEERYLEVKLTALMLPVLVVLVILSQRFIFQAPIGYARDMSAIVQGLVEETTQDYGLQRNKTRTEQLFDSVWVGQENHYYNVPLPTHRSSGLPTSPLIGTPTGRSQRPQLVLPRSTLQALTRAQEDFKTHATLQAVNNHGTYDLAEEKTNALEGSVSPAKLSETFFNDQTNDPSEVGLDRRPMNAFPADGQNVEGFALTSRISPHPERSRPTSDDTTASGDTGQLFSARRTAGDQYSRWVGLGPAQTDRTAETWETASQSVPASHSRRVRSPIVRPLRTKTFMDWTVGNASLDWIAHELSGNAGRVRSRSQEIGLPWQLTVGKNGRVIKKHDFYGRRDMESSVHDQTPRKTRITRAGQSMKRVLKGPIAKRRAAETAQTNEDLTNASGEKINTQTDSFKRKRRFKKRRAVWVSNADNRRRVSDTAYHPTQAPNLVFERATRHPRTRPRAFVNESASEKSFTANHDQVDDYFRMRAQPGGPDMWLQQVILSGSDRQFSTYSFLDQLRHQHAYSFEPRGHIETNTETPTFFTPLTKGVNNLVRETTRNLQVAVDTVYFQFARNINPGIRPVLYRIFQDNVDKSQLRQDYLVSQERKVQGLQKQGPARIRFPSLGSRDVSKDVYPAENSRKAFARAHRFDNYATSIKEDTPTNTDPMLKRPTYVTKDNLSLSNKDNRGRKKSDDRSFSNQIKSLIQGGHWTNSVFDADDPSSASAVSEGLPNVQQKAPQSIIPALETRSLDNEMRTNGSVSVSKQGFWKQFNQAGILSPLGFFGRIKKSNNNEQVGAKGVWSQSNDDARVINTLTAEELADLASLSLYSFADDDLSIFKDPTSDSRPSLQHFARMLVGLWNDASDPTFQVRSDLLALESRQESNLTSELKQADRLYSLLLITYGQATLHAFLENYSQNTHRREDGVMTITNLSSDLRQALRMRAYATLERTLPSTDTNASIRLDLEERISKALESLWKNTRDKQGQLNPLDNRGLVYELALGRLPTTLNGVGQPNPQTPTFDTYALPPATLAGVQSLLVGLRLHRETAEGKQPRQQLVDMDEPSDTTWVNTLFPARFPAGEPMFDHAQVGEQKENQSPVHGVKKLNQSVTAWLRPENPTHFFGTPFAQNNMHAHGLFDKFRTTFRGYPDVVTAITSPLRRKITSVSLGGNPYRPLVEHAQYVYDQALLPLRRLNHTLVRGTPARRTARVYTGLERHARERLAVDVLSEEGGGTLPAYSTRSVGERRRVRGDLAKNHTKWELVRVQKARKMDALLSEIQYVRTSLFDNPNYWKVRENQMGENKPTGDALSYVFDWDLVPPQKKMVLSTLYAKVDSLLDWSGFLQSPIGSDQPDTWLGSERGRAMRAFIRWMHEESDQQTSESSFSEKDVLPDRQTHLFQSSAETSSVNPFNASVLSVDQKQLDSICDMTNGSDCKRFTPLHPTTRRALGCGALAASAFEYDDVFPSFPLVSESHYYKTLHAETTRRGKYGLRGTFPAKPTFFSADHTHLPTPLSWDKHLISRTTQSKTAGTRWKQSETHDQPTTYGSVRDRRDASYPRRRDLRSHRSFARHLYFKQLVSQWDRANGKLDHTMAATLAPIDLSPAIDKNGPRPRYDAYNWDEMDEDVFDFLLWYARNLTAIVRANKVSLGVSSEKLRRHHESVRMKRQTLAAEAPGDGFSRDSLTRLDRLGLIAFVREAMGGQTPKVNTDQTNPSVQPFQPAFPLSSSESINDPTNERESLPYPVYQPSFPAVFNSSFPETAFQSKQEHLRPLSIGLLTPKSTLVGEANSKTSGQSSQPMNLDANTVQLDLMLQQRTVRHSRPLGWENLMKQRKGFKTSKKRYTRKGYTEASKRPGQPLKKTGRVQSTHTGRMKRLISPRAWKGFFKGGYPSLRRMSRENTRDKKISRIKPNEMLLRKIKNFSIITEQNRKTRGMVTHLSSGQRGSLATETHRDAFRRSASVPASRNAIVSNTLDNRRYYFHNLEKLSALPTSPWVNANKKNNHKSETNSTLRHLTGKKPAPSGDTIDPTVTALFQAPRVNESTYLREYAQATLGVSSDLERDIIRTDLPYRLVPDSGPLGQWDQSYLSSQQGDSGTLKSVDPTEESEVNIQRLQEELFGNVKNSFDKGNDSATHPSIDLTHSMHYILDLLRAQPPQNKQVRDRLRASHEVFSHLDQSIHDPAHLFDLPAQTDLAPVEKGTEDHLATSLPPDLLSSLLARDTYWMGHHALPFSPNNHVHRPEMIVAQGADRPLGQLLQLFEKSESQTPQNSSLPVGFELTDQTLKSLLTKHNLSDTVLKDSSGAYEPEWNTYLSRLRKSIAPSDLPEWSTMTLDQLARLVFVTQDEASTRYEARRAYARSLLALQSKSSDAITGEMSASRLRNMQYQLVHDAVTLWKHLHQNTEVSVSSQQERAQFAQLVERLDDRHLLDPSKLAFTQVNIKDLYNHAVNNLPFEEGDSFSADLKTNDSRRMTDLDARVNATSWMWNTLSNSLRTLVFDPVGWSLFCTSAYINQYRLTLSALITDLAANHTPDEDGLDSLIPDASIDLLRTARTRATKMVTENSGRAVQTLEAAFETLFVHDERWMNLVGFVDQVLRLERLVLAILGESFLGWEYNMMRTTLYVCEYRQFQMMTHLGFLRTQLQNLHYVDVLLEAILPLSYRGSIFGYSWEQGEENPLLADTAMILKLRTLVFNALLTTQLTHDALEKRIQNRWSDDMVLRQEVTNKGERLGRLHHDHMESVDRLSKEVKRFDQKIDSDSFIGLSSPTLRELITRRVLFVDVLESYRAADPTTGLAYSGSNPTGSIDARYDFTYAPNWFHLPFYTMNVPAGKRRSHEGDRWAIRSKPTRLHTEIFINTAVLQLFPHLNPVRSLSLRLNDREKQPVLETLDLFLWSSHDHRQTSYTNRFVNRLAREQHQDIKNLRKILLETDFQQLRDKAIIEMNLEEDDSETLKTSDSLVTDEVIQLVAFQATLLDLEENLSQRVDFLANLDDLVSESGAPIPMKDLVDDKTLKGIIRRERMRNEEKLRNHLIDNVRANASPNVWVWDSMHNTVSHKGDHLAKPTRLAANGLTVNQLLKRVDNLPSSLQSVDTNDNSDKQSKTKDKALVGQEANHKLFDAYHLSVPTDNETMSIVPNASVADNLSTRDDRLRTYVLGLTPWQRERLLRLPLRKRKSTKKNYTSEVETQKIEPSKATTYELSELDERVLEVVYKSRPKPHLLPRGQRELDRLATLGNLHAFRLTASTFQSALPTFADEGYPTTKKHGADGWFIAHPINQSRRQKELKLNAQKEKSGTYRLTTKTRQTDKKKRLANKARSSTKNSQGSQLEAVIQTLVDKERIRVKGGSSRNKPPIKQQSRKRLSGRRLHRGTRPVNLQTISASSIDPSTGRRTATNRPVPPVGGKSRKRLPRGENASQTKKQRLTLFSPDQGLLTNTTSGKRESQNQDNPFDKWKSFGAYADNPRVSKVESLGETESITQERARKIRGWIENFQLAPNIKRYFGLGNKKQRVQRNQVYKSQTKDLQDYKVKAKNVYSIPKSEITTVTGKRGRTIVPRGKRVKTARDLVSQGPYQPRDRASLDSAFDRAKEMPKADKTKKTRLRVGYHREHWARKRLNRYDRLRRVPLNQLKRRILPVPGGLSVMERKSSKRATNQMKSPGVDDSGDDSSLSSPFNSDEEVDWSNLTMPQRADMQNKSIFDITDKYDREKDRDIIDAKLTRLLNRKKPYPEDSKRSSSSSSDADTEDDEYFATDSNASDHEADDPWPVAQRHKFRIKRQAHHKKYRGKWKKMGQTLLRRPKAYQSFRQQRQKKYVGTNSRKRLLRQSFRSPKTGVVRQTIGLRKGRPKESVLRRQSLTLKKKVNKLNNKLDNVQTQVNAKRPKLRRLADVKSTQKPLWQVFESMDGLSTSKTEGGELPKGFTRRLQSLGRVGGVEQNTSNTVLKRRHNPGGIIRQRNGSLGQRSIRKRWRLGGNKTVFSETTTSERDTAPSLKALLFGGSSVLNTRIPTEDTGIPLPRQATHINLHADAKTFLSETSRDPTKVGLVFNKRVSMKDKVLDKVQFQFNSTSETKNKERTANVDEGLRDPTLVNALADAKKTFSKRSSYFSRRDAKEQKSALNNSVSSFVKPNTNRDKSILVPDFMVWVKNPTDPLLTVLQQQLLGEKGQTVDSFDTFDDVDEDDPDEDVYNENDLDDGDAMFDKNKPSDEENSSSTNEGLVIDNHQLLSSAPSEFPRPEEITDEADLFNISRVKAFNREFPNLTLLMNGSSSLSTSSDAQDVYERLAQLFTEKKSGDQSLLRREMIPGKQEDADAQSILAANHSISSGDNLSPSSVSNHGLLASDNAFMQSGLTSGPTGLLLSHLYTNVSATDPLQSVLGTLHPSNRPAPPFVVRVRNVMTGKHVYARPYRPYGKKERAARAPRNVAIHQEKNLKNADGKRKVKVGRARKTKENHYLRKGFRGALKFSQEPRQKWLYLTGRRIISPRERRLPRQRQQRARFLTNQRSTTPYRLRQMFRTGSRMRKKPKKVSVRRRVGKKIGELSQTSQQNQQDKPLQTETLNPRTMDKRGYKPMVTNQQWAEHIRPWAKYRRLTGFDKKASSSIGFRKKPRSPMGINHPVRPIKRLRRSKRSFALRRKLHQVIGSRPRNWSWSQELRQFFKEEYGSLHVERQARMQKGYTQSWTDGLVDSQATPESSHRLRTSGTEDSGSSLVQDSTLANDQSKDARTRVAFNAQQTIDTFLMSTRQHNRPNASDDLKKTTDLTATQPLPDRDIDQLITVITDSFDSSWFNLSLDHKQAKDALRPHLHEIVLAASTALQNRLTELVVTEQKLSDRWFDRWIRANDADRFKNLQIETMRMIGMYTQESFSDLHLESPSTATDNLLPSNTKLGVNFHDLLNESRTIKTRALSDPLVVFTPAYEDFYTRVLVFGDEFTRSMVGHFLYGVLWNGQTWESNRESLSLVDQKMLMEEKIITAISVSLAAALTNYLVCPVSASDALAASVVGLEKFEPKTEATRGTTLTEPIFYADLPTENLRSTYTNQEWAHLWTTIKDRVFQDDDQVTQKHVSNKLISTNKPIRWEDINDHFPSDRRLLDDETERIWLGSERTRPLIPQGLDSPNSSTQSPLITVRGLEYFQKKVALILLDRALSIQAMREKAQSDQRVDRLAQSGPLGIQPAELENLAPYEVITPSTERTRDRLTHFVLGTPDENDVGWGQTSEGWGRYHTTHEVLPYNKTQPLTSHTEVNTPLVARTHFVTPVVRPTYSLESGYGTNARVHRGIRPSYSHPDQRFHRVISHRWHVEDSNLSCLLTDTSHNRVEYDDFCIHWTFEPFADTTGLAHRNTNLSNQSLPFPIDQQGNKQENPPHPFLAPDARFISQQLDTRVSVRPRTSMLWDNRTLRRAR